MSPRRRGFGVRADGRGQDLDQQTKAKWKLEGRTMEGFSIRKPLQADSDGLGWAGLDPLVMMMMYLCTCRGGDSNERKGRSAVTSCRHGPAREANEHSSLPGSGICRVHVFRKVKFAIKVHGGNAEETGESTGKDIAYP